MLPAPPDSLVPCERGGGAVVVVVDFWSSYSKKIPSLFAARFKGPGRRREGGETVAVGRRVCVRELFCCFSVAGGAGSCIRLKFPDRFWLSLAPQKYYPVLILLPGFVSLVSYKISVGWMVLLVLVTCDAGEGLTGA